ncbi:hypothetical protein ACWEVD_24535 [Nocardia thailandica]|uniref:IrrE N-terminal-like domain-containing protein n=1 Tax=Nocardia thailandica TaxID=257275 RepID=A0ABW6PKV7_9NOCA|nr:hypothetical protein [Nocardia thailandica]
MQRRFDRLAAAVPIPRPWDLADYVDAVAGYRRRPITLRPVEGSLLGSGCGTGSGLWIAQRDADLIVYSADTAPAHAEHIVVHELGHMLLGHGPDENDADPLGGHSMDMLTELLPSISPESIAHVLGRTGYGTVREREAESFADHVILTATGPQRPPSALHRAFYRGSR